MSKTQIKTAKTRASSPNKKADIAKLAPTKKGLTKRGSAMVRPPSATRLSYEMAEAAAPALDRPVVALSKIDRIVRLLRQSDGVALSELVTLTSWLPHTLRAALSRLRQKGYVIERFQTPDGTTRYHITASETTTPAPKRPA